MTLRVVNLVGGVSLLVLMMMLASAVAVAVSGCSRNLNERTEQERIHAAGEFRTRGDFDVANGRLVRAVGHYMEAVRILPEDSHSFWALARIYHTLGFETHAAVMATKARQTDPAIYETKELEIIPIDDPETQAAALAPRPIPEDADWVRPPATQQ